MSDPVRVRAKSEKGKFLVPLPELSNLIVIRVTL